MLAPDWKHAETIQKRIRVTRVKLREHHLDAVELEFGENLCLDAVSSVDLGKIKRAKIYHATINVYHAEFTDELERYLTESAMDDLEQLKAIRAMKASGSGLTKLELVTLKH